MESYSFSLGNDGQWQSSTEALQGGQESGGSVPWTDAIFRNDRTTAREAPDDALFDQHLIPLAEDEAPYTSSEQLPPKAPVLTRKRKAQEQATLQADIFQDATRAVPDWFRAEFPDLVPAVPLLEERSVPYHIVNPFHPQINQKIIHPRLRTRAISLFNTADRAINGLVKFRLHVKNDRSENFKSKQTWVADGATTMQQSDNPFLHPAPNLPPDFGRGIKMDATDAKLLKFYLIAFCTGRTLLPGSNCFLNEIAAMACGNPCVRHGLLALASTYVLDYLPSKQLEQRANTHYHRSVLLLSQALSSSETYEPGKEDVVITTLVLLSVNDLVNWEGNQTSLNVPEWLTGNRTAKIVLDISDPGYKFQHPENVQYSNVRRYMGGKAALVEIFCSVMAPLETVLKECPYPWLLEGTEREIRKIDGLNGLSPKLLHMYAQVTHLSSRLATRPDSSVIPRAGRVLEEKLANFWQWSEFSEGYETAEDLLASCSLDETGKVTSARKVTELTAECYVTSAEIYLQCRLFRKPRAHQTVQNLANRLLDCIVRMPTSGHTFTAMAPMFSIFVTGLVVYRSADRDIIRDWFVGVIKGTRGNVPPAWKALQTVWLWQDDVLEREERADSDFHREELMEDDTRVTDRRDWWEEMVMEIDRNVGKMNLA